MKLNNYFFPDYSKKSGLGHFYRCYKYSKLIKKGKIYFLYINKFKPNLKKILKKSGIILMKFDLNFFNSKKKKKFFKYINNRFIHKKKFRIK